MRPLAHDEAGNAAPSAMVPSLVTFAVVGMAMAFGIWCVRHWTALPAFLDTNHLAAPLRRQLVGALAAGAGTVVVVGVVASRPWRGWSFGAAWCNARRAAPLGVLGLLPALLCRDAWTRDPIAFLVATALVGLVTLASVRLALGSLPLTVWTDAHVALWRTALRRVRWLAPASVVLAATFYAAFFSRFTIGDHYHLHTRVFDLAVEHNLLWQAAHGGPLFRTTPFGGPMSHLGWHQTYFTYLLALPFRLWPYPETMLVFQATIIGFTAIPVYLVSRRRIGSPAAAVLAVLFIFYAPTHGANLYDFHYQTCFGFFALFALHAVESRRWIAALILGLVTLSIREDAGLILGSVGLYLVLRREHPRFGTAFILMSAIHFLVLKVLVMPRFLHGQQAYAGVYSSLVAPGQSGFGSVLQTIVANPFFTLDTLLEQRKLVYALSIFVPLAFLPLRRPLAFALLLPGIFVTLLASHAPVLMLSFQYTMVWGGLAFVAAMLGLERARREGHGRLPGRAELLAWLAALTVTMLVTSNQLGVIFSQRDARGGFQPMHWRHTPADRQRHADLYALIAQIPPEAGVLGTNWVISHVSARDKAYWIQTEVNQEDCEYLLFETTRLQELEPSRIGALLRAGTYGVIERRGDFVLARRGHPTTLNASVIASVHLP